MLSPEDNELLCRVEGDAPMGQLMRRHWIPACLSEEIAAPDGVPLSLRLLGEDLVAWRDSAGRVGLTDRLCAHRRSSLAYGRNEKGGLRCLYHGWKYDVEGNLIEMPSEPSGKCPNIRIKSYPTQEWGGMIWTYMGSRDTMPAFEPPGFAPTERAKVSIVKIKIDCNWAQILEGAIDSSHSSSLHSSEITPSQGSQTRATGQLFLRPSADKAPRIQYAPTSYGFKYAALRRPFVNPDTHEYVRTTLFLAPFTVLIPPTNLFSLANINVPIDDTHTMFHFVAWSETEVGAPDQEDWRKFCGAQVGIDLDLHFGNNRRLDNGHLQDRTAMALGNYTGIRGIPQQDIAMWETMGAITERHHDRLGGSDLAIIQFRRQMVDAVKQFQAGAAAIGTRAAGGSEFTPQSELRSFEGVLPKTTEWRDLVTTVAQHRHKASNGGLAFRHTADTEGA